MEDAKQDVIEQMRQDCEDSLYIFARVACGFNKFKPELHKKMCDFLQSDGSIRKLLLAPRDHFKSSVVQAYVLWRLINNPEERILIAGDTAGTAENKLEKIKNILKHSSTLQALWPNLVPKSKVGVRWSQQEIELNRNEAHAEPSITALGVGGARAGAHYTLIICDDIATKEAKDQPTTMRKTIEWFNGLEAMLVEPYKNEIVLVGTPWAHDDVHEHADHSWRSGTTKKFYEAMVLPFWGEDDLPIFPELYGGIDNAMDFARRMAESDPYLWSCNFLLSPSIPDAEFDESELMYYSLSKNHEFAIIRKDIHEEDLERKGPAREAADPEIVSLSGLRTYIAVDPAFKKDASASKAAINVSSPLPDGRVIVRESIGIRGGTFALVEKLIDLCRKYEGSLHKIGIESVAQQQSFIDLMNREMRQRGIYKRVEPMPPGSSKSKEARIRSILQPLFAQRRIFLRPNMRGLIEEFRKFPLSQTRDELDAMAYAAEYFWNKGTPEGSNETYDVYFRKYRDDRNSASRLTGY